MDGILRHRWSEAHVHRALHRPHDAVDMGVVRRPLLLWDVTWPDLPQMSTDPKLLFSSNGTEAWQPWRLRAERELDLPSLMRGRISIRHDQLDRDLIPIAEMEGLAEEVTGDDLHDVHMP